ncbi:hypothetical protein GGR51DRAFT_562918 [Nemania sp. FL0031]|nr:hypothetical protein GGR51DRAFT_562918 [Nemania sp. FL0031]
MWGGPPRFGGPPGFPPGRPPPGFPPGRPPPGFPPGPPPMWPPGRPPHGRPQEPMPSREEKRAMAKSEARNIGRYFERHRDQFEFIGYLNNGFTGVSCKVRLRSDRGRRKAQNFVIKRPIIQNEIVESRLKEEFRYLRLFRGARHILQLFYVPGSVKNPIENAPGTSIMTEWIENGILADFISRNNKKQLPNRLLLELFTCLVQFCVAMAWPPHGDRGAPHQEERIPSDIHKRRNKDQIVHNDMHCSNIMIGSLNPEGGGHNLVPILKLIDFDRMSTLHSPPGLDAGVSQNIRDIGFVMRTLITGDLAMEPPPPQLVTVRVAGATRSFMTYGTDVTRRMHTNLDEEIASLVQWCLADAPARPTLEMLHFELHALKKKATPERYAKYPMAKFESDSEIRRLVQRYILDAD